jgi:long-chain fatty acid transport protein
VLPIDERWAIGTSLTAPYGLGLKYDSGWAGRYYVEKIGLQTLNATVGVGYRASDWLSLGAGVSLQHAQARYRRKLNNVLDGLPDGTFSMKLSDWAVGFNAGAVIDLSSDLRLGVSYRSRLDQELTGDADLSGVGPTLAGLGVSGTRARFPVSLPDHVVASLEWRPFADVGLTAEAAWSGWGGLNTASVTLNSGFVDATERNWDDTYRVGLAAEIALNPKTIVRTGVSYDSSPTNAKYRLPDLPADRQIAFALGIEREVSKDVKLSVGYTYADLGDNRIAANLGPLNGPLSGELNEHIQYFGVGVSAAF